MELIEHSDRKAMAEKGEEERSAESMVDSTGEEKDCTLC